MALKDIVNVSITRETAPVSRAGFGTLLILGAHKAWNDRFRSYTGPEGILSDGFTSADPEYKAAQAAFAQNPRPVRVAIGRRTVDTVIVTVSEVAEGQEYSTLINGTAFSYTAASGNTAAVIAGALVTAINAGSEPVTATDNSDGTYTLAADTSGTAYSLSVDSRQSLGALTANKAMADDLNAVRDENNNWYGLVLTTRDKTQQAAAAAWVEAHTKLLGLASADTDIIDKSKTEDTGSIAATLENGNYFRTFLIYSKDIDDFADAAWMGKELPTDPGSTTWKFKTLAGVTEDTLTDTQYGNAKAKKCNVFTEVAGKAITEEGVVSGGEFIDIIRGRDWLEARMTEEIYSLLTRKPKVPYTDGGIAAIEAIIRQMLDLGISRGFIAPAYVDEETNSVVPSYEITTPKVRNIPFNDRANRILDDLTFRATVAGAIHVVDINGTITAGELSA